MRLINFIVQGPPPTKGSVRIISRRSKRTGRLRSVPINDNPKTKGWSASAALLCKRTMAGGPLFAHPGVRVWIGLKNPEGKPDLDKVLRAVLDSLKGIAYADDCMVTAAQVRKEFSLAAPYTQIEVYDADR